MHGKLLWGIGLAWLRLIKSTNKLTFRRVYGATWDSLMMCEQGTDWESTAVTGRWLLNAYCCNGFSNISGCHYSPLVENLSFVVITVVQRSDTVNGAAHPHNHSTYRCRNHVHEVFGKLVLRFTHSGIQKRSTFLQYVKQKHFKKRRLQD